MNCIWIFLFVVFLCSWSEYIDTYSNGNVYLSKKDLSGAYLCNPGNLYTSVHLKKAEFQVHEPWPYLNHHTLAIKCQNVYRNTLFWTMQRWKGPHSNSPRSILNYFTNSVWLKYQLQLFYGMGFLHLFLFPNVAFWISI